MKSFISKISSLITLGLLGMTSFANAAGGCTQNPNGGQDLCTVARGTIVPYINTGIYLLIAVAVIIFVYCIIKYFIAPSDGAERAEAGKYVMYSLIGFFIILALWGLVNILVNTFRLDGSSSNLDRFQNLYGDSSSNGSSGSYGSNGSYSSNNWSVGVSADITPRGVRNVSSYSTVNR